MSNKYYSIISIIGLSNVGKSYIFNKLLNKYRSIVNNKTQFTRRLIIEKLYIKNKIILLIDTPGYFFKTKYELHNIMLNYIKKSISISNILLYVTINNYNIFKKDLKFIYKYKKEFLKKKMLLIIFNNNINKKIYNFYIKFFNRNNIIIINYNEINIYDKLIKKIYNLINNEEKIYNNISFNLNKNKFFISEIIRDYIYKIYNKEIPYSCEIQIEDYILKGEKIYIYSIIYLEKISQKKILIGSYGKSINLLSLLIRKRIKRIYNINNVYIKFIFKIKKWKNNKNYLKLFVY